MSKTYRLATKEDVREVVSMGVEFYQESYGKTIPLRLEDMVVAFNRMIDNGYIYVCINELNEFIGGIGFIISPYMYNSYHKVATELFWWVTPTERNSPVGLRLMKKGEACAADAGCTLICMSLLSSSPQSVGKIYEKLGYVFSEGTYMKELK